MDSNDSLEMKKNNIFVHINILILKIKIQIFIKKKYRIKKETDDKILINTMNLVVNVV